MKRLVSILLISALTFGGFGCSVISHVTRYTNADQYTAGGFTYDAAAVTRVEVEWAAGGVTLSHGTGTLTVSESGGDTLSTSEKLHWWLDGTTLRIKYCESGFSHVIQPKQKDLTLELPEGVDLRIDIASGKTKADRLAVGTLDLNTASGGVEILELTAKTVDIDTASGGVYLGTVAVENTLTVDTASGGFEVNELSCKTVKVDSASGGVKLGLDEVQTVKVNVASGRVTLKLLDAARGATLRLNKLSGGFDCKLPMTAEGKSYKIGNGEIQITVDSASGGITVE